MSHVAKVHCARTSATLRSLYPSEPDRLVSWCHRQWDVERPLSSVVHHTLWDFIPSTARCGLCEKSIGPGRVNAAIVTTVETALSLIARVWRVA